MKLELREHPRLYVGKQALERLGLSADTPMLERSARAVSEAALEYSRSPVVEYPAEAHNALLLRARAMQTRVVTLLVEWYRTGEQTYHRAVIEHLREMSSWEYWSWLSMRKNDARPEAFFDLSYGENATTIAIAWDWLGGDIPSDDRAMIERMAKRWVIDPYLENTSRTEPPHWFRNEHSNWNTVCSGGAGMLAIAMHEVFPDDADAVLERVEYSIEPYFDTLARTNGGWEEGVGYWNYGMRYAFMYVLSHERAFGREHPFFSKRGVAETLEFPLDFSPYAIGCSFGDVNRWSPLPIHYAMAQRFGRLDLVGMLDDLLACESDAVSSWPNDAELLLLRPRDTIRKAGAAGNGVKPYAKLYRGLEWCVLADRWPSPGLYFSVRGGSTEVAHGHTDLLAFHCVADGEKLLTHADVGPYNDMTFGPRRYEIFEMNPHATNTFLVNGVGISKPSSVTPELVGVGDTRGVRLDATDAFGVMRDGPVARFAGRLVMLLSSRTALLVDRMALHRYGRLETRLHTPGRVTEMENAVRIEGDRATVSLAFASDVPSALHHAVDPLTNPGPVYRMIRWCTDELVHAGTLVTAISRDPGCSVVIDGAAEAEESTITVRDATSVHRVRMGARLELFDG